MNKTKRNVSNPANQSIMVATLKSGGLTWSADQAHVGEKKATGAKPRGGRDANRSPGRESGKGKICLRVGTPMKKRDGEVADMADRRKLDFCCVQECRWRAGSARWMGEYKFFWAVYNEWTAGVRVLVAKRWVESVIEVKRVNERLIVVKVAIKKSTVNVISVYAPQSGRSQQDKEKFYEVLGRTVNDVGDGEGLFICGDLNGCVGEMVIVVCMGDMGIMEVEIWKGN